MLGVWRVHLPARTVPALLSAVTKLGSGGGVEAVYALVLVHWVLTVLRTDSASAVAVGSIAGGLTEAPSVSGAHIDKLLVPAGSDPVLSLPGWAALSTGLGQGVAVRWAATLTQLAHRAPHVCSLVARVAKAQRPVVECGQVNGKRQRGGDGDDDGSDGAGEGDEVEMTRACVKMLQLCIPDTLHDSADDGQNNSDMDRTRDGAISNDSTLAALPTVVLTALAALLAAPCVQALFDTPVLPPVHALPTDGVEGSRQGVASRVSLDRAFRAIAAVAPLV